MSIGILSIAQAKEALTRCTRAEKEFMLRNPREGMHLLELHWFFPDAVEEITVEDTPHARSDDPRTSQRAAAEIEAEEGPTSVIQPETLKHLALRELDFGGPRHAVGLERDTGRRGIWKRVSDLKHAELVDVVGTVRDPQTQKEGDIVQINERGRLALRELDAGRKVTL